jgi:hypothetical protein
VGQPHITAHPRPRTTQAATAIVSVVLHPRLESVAIGLSGDRNIDAALASGALLTCYFLGVPGVVWAIPPPSLVVVGHAVLAVFNGMLYLANQKRYGRSDTGFELSSRAGVVVEADRVHNADAQGAPPGSPRACSRPSSHLAWPAQGWRKVAPRADTGGTMDPAGTAARLGQVEARHTAAVQEGRPSSPPRTSLQRTRRRCPARMTTPWGRLVRIRRRRRRWTRGDRHRCAVPAEHQHTRRAHGHARRHASATMGRLPMPPRTHTAQSPWAVPRGGRVGGPQRALWCRMAGGGCVPRAVYSCLFDRGGPGLRCGAWDVAWSARSARRSGDGTIRAQSALPPRNLRKDRERRELL